MQTRDDSAPDTEVSGVMGGYYRVEPANVDGSAQNTWHIVDREGKIFGHPGALKAKQALCEVMNYVDQCAQLRTIEELTHASGIISPAVVGSIRHAHVSDKDTDR